MIVLKPRLKALFMQGMELLRKEEVQPTPDEVVWLYTLAEKAINPNAGMNIAFFDSPIKVGSIRLYPLSIQASIWIEKYAKNWWESNRKKDLLAVAFAMAHSNCGDVLLLMTDKRRAWRKIRRWSFRHLFVSHKRLIVAIQQILGDYEYVSVNEIRKQVESPEWGEVISILCGAYHLEPDVFLWHHSTATIMEMLRNMPAGSGEKPSHDSIKAIIEWQKTLKFIINSHKQDAESSVIKDE